MAPRLKSVVAVLAAVGVVSTAACAGDPASNLEATIEAGVAATIVGVEIDKAVKATMSPSLAKEHFRRGWDYGKLGEHEKAIQEYGKGIELDSNNAIAYYNRGLAYGYLAQISLGSTDYLDTLHQRAIEDFDKVIQLDPNDAINYADAYYNRGYTYGELGEHQRAIQDYDKVIQLDPNYADAYNNRGVAYVELDQDTEADADFAKACSLESQYC